MKALTEQKYQALRPFICARGAARPQLVNINTLSIKQAPLLAAILGGTEGLNTAAQLIQNRPATGYSDLTTLRAAPALEDYEIKNAQLDQLSFKPDYLWIEAKITYQTAQRIMAFEFAIEGTGLTRLYRGIGSEALRPLLESPAL